MQASESRSLTFADVRPNLLPMKYRRLGKAGVKVSELSFGSWLTFGNQISDDVAEALMRKSYDSGVNFFDNAEAYARGCSELVMGKILKKVGWPRDTWLVSSKVFFGAAPEPQKPNQYGLSRKHVFEACHDALRRLQIDYLDFFFCHRPDSETPIEETVRVMSDLIAQGKVLYWGTSEWSAQEIMQACTVAAQFNLVPPAMEQPQYSLLVRERVEKEYARLYSEIGLGTTVWSPLASGLLTGKYKGGIPKETRLAFEENKWLRDYFLSDEKLAKVSELAAVASDLGISQAVLAIAWCLRNPNVSTVILGASKEPQLEETLTASEAAEKITPDVVERIEQLLQNNPLKYDRATLWILGGGLRETGRQDFARTLRPAGVTRLGDPQHLDAPCLPKSDKNLFLTYLFRVATLLLPSRLMALLLWESERGNCHSKGFPLNGSFCFPRMVSISISSRYSTS
jgi:voltage-dependent potassium channel beta subunit